MCEDKTRLFGHSPFDLNRDGKVSGSEIAFVEEAFFEGEENGDFTQKSKKAHKSNGHTGESCQ
ncbi:MAG: hypothetical protein K6G10_04180 [Butyrivibrio sp.]|nr:hypothetical protein [Butyrivibrio sp.]